MYRRLIMSKRCVVVSNGYYEWQTSSDGKKKTPYYISLPDGEVMAMAGLYDSWKNKETGLFVFLSPKKLI